MGRPPLIQRARARMRARGNRRPRRVSGRAALPNVVTLLGLCAGLTAIRFAIEGRFDLALGGVGAAAILDALDGRMARLLKATSRFGAELDSLADFVDFGVAPAVILYLWAFSGLRSIGWVVALAFALAAALRLARFNIAVEEPGRPPWKAAYFVGVPTPAAALVVLLPIYLQGLGVPMREFGAPAILVLTLAVAALMVSRLPTFSGKMPGRVVAREDVPRVIVLGVLVAALFATYPYLMLTVAAVAYLGSLPFSARAYASAGKS